MSEKLYASLEAGGTKFVCAVGDSNFEVVEKIQFPTTTPEETIGQAIEFFSKFDLAGLAIGSFGPLDIAHSSETYGYITTTPKPHWANVDLVAPFKDALEIPVYVTTDVNSSAFGEIVARNHKVNHLVYYTIGTGIGAGVIQDGLFIGGQGHPEMGHVPVAVHDLDREAGFEGVCPFHGACLEGMAAGPSLEARTGIRGENIGLDSDVWDIQAYYIAQAAVQATVTFRPQVIVFGGGVMAQEHMLKRVHQQFEKLLNGYLPVPDLNDYIVTPAVPDNGSATLGNFVLAKEVSES
ncbi:MULTISPECIES: fructokinase ScrK [unclassified Streptococcus]|uniref:fructokinase ScrK n=1 Tax=unclassified Streptococcus TaxID=2608887 RepID=UPI0018ABF7BD|nr:MULTISPECIES: fructokinase ScrK [unclassified Streptococcus]MBF8970435.1 ROK family protein [Streptococcus sp. NLN76]MBG9367226.1 ROK family protein [Streptococcus sp. NLN64]